MLPHESDPKIMAKIRNRSQRDPHFRKRYSDYVNHQERIEDQGGIGLFFIVASYGLMCGILGPFGITPWSIAILGVTETVLFSFMGWLMWKWSKEPW